MGGNGGSPLSPPPPPTGLSIPPSPNPWDKRTCLRRPAEEKQKPGRLDLRLLQRVCRAFPLSPAAG